MKKNLGENFNDNIRFSHKYVGTGQSIESASQWQDGLLKGLSISSEQGLPDFVVRRASLSYLVLTLTFIFLFLRIFNLQILAGNKNYVLSEENRIRIKDIQPERGLIYDAEGEVLAKNEPAFVLGLDLTSLKKDQIPAVLQELSKITALSVHESQIKADKAYDGGLQEVILLRGLTRDTVLALETYSQELPGVYLDTAPIRKYTDPEALAHVLGYTGEISDQDLVEYASYQYKSGDTLGKSGLESYYEKYLHGKPGRRLLERDATGKKLREISSSPVQMGSALTLTLNRKLQDVAFNALREVTEKNKVAGGAVVALRPSSGEVLVLASYPSFDTNLFSGELPTSVYQKIADDERMPFLNRAISAQYPPASTFKLVTATAALEEGVVTPETQINEVQSISVGGSTFSNWTLLWGVAPHGLLDIRGALAQSSDIYFYEVGGGFEAQEGLGIEKLSKWSQRFGLGLPAGIDLFGEVGGLVPSAEYKMQAKGEDWYLGDTYISAIGQGDTLSTPLQVALMTSVVANGGDLHRPYLVEKIIGADGKLLQEATPTVLRKVSSPEVLNVVRDGMREAVEYGTSVELRDHPGRIAAKTGTAETGDIKNLHAWFTCFAPYDNPEIVVTVLVEGGGQGSQTSLPIARKVLDTYFGVGK